MARVAGAIPYADFPIAWHAAEERLAGIHDMDGFVGRDFPRVPEIARFIPEELGCARHENAVSCLPFATRIVRTGSQDPAQPGLHNTMPKGLERYSQRTAQA